jgi:uroporphyrinogen-III synthase
MPNPNEKTYALFSTPTNKKIIAALQERGAKVFQFPPLETEKTVLDEKLIHCIKNLNAYDWVIFPDVLTVDYFLQMLEENEIDLFEMDSLQVCAFGETVADQLRFVQLHSDVIPTSIEATQIFSALSDYIGSDGLNNVKFLLVKESSLEYEIKEKLIKNGANISELPIYQAKISKSDEITRLKILLNSGAIDEFVFSSPVDLIALSFYFGNNRLSEILSEITVSMVDKSVSQTLNDHNLKSNLFKFQ